MQKFIRQSLYTFARNVVRPPNSKEAEIKALIQKGKSDQQIIQMLAKEKVQDRVQVYSANLSKDQKLKELAKQDIDESMKEVDEYVEPLKRGAGQLPKTILDDKPNSQKQMKLREEQLVQMMGHESRDLARQMAKEEFFTNQKLEEDAKIFENNLKKREKQREIRKISNNLSAYDWLDQFSSKEIPIDKKVESTDLIKDPNELWLHRTKKNIVSYVEDFFNTQRTNIDVNLVEISTNKSCTVVNVYWDLPELQEYRLKEYLTLAKSQKQFDEMMKVLIKKRRAVQKQISKVAGYLGGQCCQELGLKYAPEIRFHISNKYENLEKLQKQFIDSKEDIIQERIKEIKEEDNNAKINYQEIEQDISNRIAELNTNDVPNSYTQKVRGPRQKLNRAGRIQKFWNGL